MRSEDFLTTHEVAHLLGVAPVTIRRAIAAGHLDVAKTPGGHNRIPVPMARDLASRLGYVWSAADESGSR